MEHSVHYSNESATVAYFLWW